MKRLIYFSSVVALVALAISCQKFDSTPQFAKSNSTLTVSASTTAVAVAAADSLKDALTLTWNDPKYAVGLANTKFTVMVSPTGSSFATFGSKQFVGVLKGDLSGKDINGIAVQLGATIGQPIAMDVKVLASQENNNEPIYSNTLQVTVTPYGDLSLAATSLDVVCAAVTASEVGDTLSWTVAFNGFAGVKTYQMEYAKGGTAFASPTPVDITGFMKTFTQLDLNKIALGFGTAPGSAGDVDFRIKATNEKGAVVYSNTVTVSVTTYVANNSIGIIGDATPGGWNTDTDMYRLDPANNPGAWTVIIKLTGGLSAKFRADDDWGTNWGAAGFPSGTGTQNGANIPVSSTGYYKVDFNAGTGAYVFTPLAGTTFTNISLIGDVVLPNAWSSDFDLTQDGTDPHLWTGSIVFANDGSVKFRANHDWTTNWGFNKFPSAYGTQNGDNIPVKAGTYFVRFNDVSGDFIFGNTGNNAGASSPYTNISLIGDFNGWSADVDLIQNPINPFKWSGKTTLPATGAKVRANHAWTISWGGATFPTGAGTTSGDPNITIPAGTYQINFNSATGEYKFEN